VFRKTLATVVALGVLIGGAIVTTAQDRGDRGTAARTGLRDCPPASARSDARGMTAQAGSATPPASRRSGWMEGWTQGGTGGWRNPFGSPGMYTGVDTGVTRGPALGSGTGTTGTYGAGVESSGIASTPPDLHGTGHGSASSGRTANPC
jgi:hypothetical protein